MTIAVAAAPRASGLFQQAPSNGQSDSAKALEEFCREIRLHFLRSVTLSAPSEEALQELESVRAGASTHGWNGYGGSALDPHAYWEARRFIQALPVNTPKPDISVDGDGEVSFDWLFAQGLALSLSISGNGRLTFASILGPRAVQGTEWLDDGIPARVLDELAMVVQEARLASAI